MPEDSRLTRRTVIRAGALAAAGVLVRPSLLLASCEPTEGSFTGAENADTWSGPFWKEGAPFRYNLRGRRADGQVLIVSGRVTSAHKCRPLPHAVLDIWHCSPDGVYFTNSEHKEAGLFRGRIRSDENGFYEYETLVPTNYLVGGAMRPAHIRVKAHAPHHRELITQMYFEDDAYLDSDPLGITRESLICKLTQRDPGEPFRDRRSAGPFASTEFNLVVSFRG